jgi:lauroyl/myristoyl acyltransferase
MSWIRRLIAAGSRPAGLPYDLGAPLLAHLWAQRPAQRLALRRLQKRFPAHPFYSEADLDRERLQRHLNSRTFREWREFALDRCSDRSFARWTHFHGTEHLEAARAHGRGLILAGSHHGEAQTLKILLTRFGLDVTNLGSGRERGPWRHARVLWVGDKENEADLLRSMVALRRVLKQGGIVHLPADARVGKSGIEMDFLGRRRRFAHGFAALALTMGAPVVPVFALLEGDGSIRVEFHPPLEVPPHGSRSERLESLIRQYVACLERSCREHPELMMPRYSNWLAKQPPARAPTSGADPSQ